MASKKTKAQVSNSGAVDSGVGGPLCGSEGSSQTQQTGVDQPIEEFDPSGLKVVARLTPEQYWEWRTTTAEMNLADREMDVAAAQATILAKEAEIAKLRMSLHGNTAMPKAKAKKEEATKEYHDFRLALEKKLGVSMADKVIDETFAVKDLGSAPGTV